MSELEFPLLRTGADFQSEAPPPQIRNCQELIRWADHIVILFPLCGFRPVHAWVVGMVDDLGPKGRGEWLAKVQELGVQGK